jgi:hypothetical protein
MTPAEYRTAADEAAANGNRAKAAGLRAAATRAERSGAPLDTGPAKRQPVTVRIPERLQAIADSLVIPVDEGGMVGTSVGAMIGDPPRLQWNHDGGRDKRPVDDERLDGLPVGDLIKISLAVNRRIEP